HFRIQAAHHDRKRRRITVKSIPAASGLSQLNFGIDRLELAAGIVDLHLPVDASLDAVDVAGPSGSLRSQGRDIAKVAARDALGCQATQLVLGDVEPTAVLGGEAELDPTDELACSFGGEALVESALGVRVQVVAYDGNALDVSVSA